jgi:peptidoglycan hydrolase-like protein with peptidoglycan-binding domain
MQDKLMQRGYLGKGQLSGRIDGSTIKALRDFQRDRGLPATGIPDDLTVRKLGLRPEDVFRASATPDR